MAYTNESILDSVKDTLGIAKDDDSFDAEIRMDINSALATLNQVGCGNVVMISDSSTKWSDFADPTSEQFGLIQQFVFIKTKLLFDPPAASTLNAFKEASNELIWRIQMAFDHIEEVETK